LKGEIDMAASATKFTYLMNGGAAASTASWGTTPACTIKDYSDLEGTPNYLDTTTLSDDVQTQVPGVKQAEAWTFTCNYDPTEYQALKTHEGEDEHWAVWLGGSMVSGVSTPNGDQGKFATTGILSVGVTSGSVDAVREMSVSIARTSGVTPTFSA
jgi:hypothetical protein